MDGIWHIVGKKVGSLKKFCFKCWLPEGAKHFPKPPRRKKTKLCVAKDTHFFELHSQLLVLQQRLLLVLLPWWKTKKTAKKRPKHNDANGSLLVLTPHLFIDNTCTKKHTNYGWCFRNPVNQLICGLSHYLQGFSTIPGGDCRISEPSTRSSTTYVLGTMPCACVIHLGSGYLQRMLKVPGREDRINGYDQLVPSLR